MAALVLLQAKLLGYADQYLWPSAPQLANPMNLVAFAALVGFGAQFTRRFLAGGPADRLAAPAIIAMQAASAAAVLSLAVVPYGVAIQAMIGIGLLAALLLSAVILRAWSRGFTAARSILLSFAALIAGGVPYMLRVTGAVGEGFPAGESLDVATAAEALLLSFALADRINMLRSQRQVAEASLRDAQLRFTERLIESQDSDRRRIAGELHDALGQNVLVLRNRLLAFLRRPDAAASRAELSTLADFTGEMTEQVRTMARDLHPPELERLGLRAALEGMLRRSLADTGLQWRCDVTAADRDIVPEHRVHVYRIAQEAITNVLKHATARSVTLSLQEAGGRVNLVVEDRGKGLSASVEASGFGLAGIRERVRLIGGTLALDAASSGGTRLSVDFAKGVAP
jgi:signal transduction histidine kinase